MRKILLLAALGLMAAMPAKAATFQYDAVAVPLGQNVGISGVRNAEVDAGQVVLTGSGADAGQFADVWCVDLLDNLQSSSIYNLTPLTTAGVGGANPTLTSTQISEMGSLMINGDKDVLDNAEGPDGSIAFQLAIWSVEYGAAFSDNANSIIQTIVASLISDVSPGGKFFCPNCGVELFDAAEQNQVMGTGITPTPIPGALSLFAGGLAMFGLVGRRKRKQQKLLAA
jgi:hypothetical protein